MIPAEIFLAGYGRDAHDDRRNTLRRYAGATRKPHLRRRGRPPRR